jgi:hypothetical protein
MTELEHLPRPSASAERMRRFRERRRRGLSCIKVQLRRSEVDALSACGFLGATDRENRSATRNDEKVTRHLPGAAGEARGGETRAHAASGHHGPTDQLRRCTARSTKCARPPIDEKQSSLSTERSGPPFRSAASWCH